MTGKVTSTVLLAALALAANAQTAVTQDLEAVEIVTVPVADGVYMLTGAGGNIGVSVGRDGIILVDDQFAPLNERILAALAELSDGEVRFVVNTHWHDDHTNGNELLGGSGAIIVAHENTRQRLNSDQFVEFFDNQVPAKPRAALPVITFRDEVSIHFNDDRIDVVHVELAHTDGDAILFLRGANVVHMGDIFFSGGFPFIDVPNGGTIDGTIAAVQQVLSMIDDDTKVIPGHGPLADRARLAAYGEMLMRMRLRVTQAISEGHTLETMLEMGLTTDFEGEWGGAIPGPGFVRILYSDLAR